LESWFLHIPGIKVVIPSTPYDGKGLLKAAIRDDNPVVFIEQSMLYGRLGPVPDGEYIIELGKADIKKEGNDITLIAWSRMVQDALNAAEELEKEGISVEVLDPRTLVPLDTSTIIKSVSKTGKVIIYHEAMKRGGAGAEIAATINELCFEYLEAPIMRIGALEVPIPQSPILEKVVVPNKDRILSSARKLMMGD
jgi:pyruvate/2-oxoglutarate/acetoin dehydrogenase E1 component